MVLGVLRLPNKAVGVGRERAGVKAPSGCKPKSIVNDREFKKHLVALRLERERKEAQAANAALKKPPATAKPQKAKKKHSSCRNPTEESKWTRMTAGCKFGPR